MNICRLQAILQRPSLSDSPASMVDHIPTVTSSLSDQQMPLQPVFNQHLLASWSVIIPTTISQVRFCVLYPILLASSPQMLCQTNSLQASLLTSSWDARDPLHLRRQCKSMVVHLAWLPLRPTWLLYLSHQICSSQILGMLRLMSPTFMSQL